MLEDLGDSGIDHGGEGRGMLTRSECILGDEFLDPALLRTRDVQLPVAISVAPEDVIMLGIRDLRPVQLPPATAFRPSVRSENAPIACTARNAPG